MKRDIRPVQVIQGGQYGSEAKGAIAAYLCQRDDINIAVRTGATNAGHTILTHGETVKMQQLPVGWVNPETVLVLGAGAVVDLAILKREMDLITRLTGSDVRNRLKIDYRASIHLPEHQERSKAANRHHSIGATGKGCSEAIIDKIRNRGVRRMTLGELADDLDLRRELRLPLEDTCTYLNVSLDRGRSVQLEGTQGTLLDLHLGPYPYTTHKQTGPAQWMMEAGLSPALPTDIVMVCRTFPIRVAGNSGPLPREISWPILVREMNDKLSGYGIDSLVSESALQSFETAVTEICRTKYRNLIPIDSTGLDQHEWNDFQRRHFRLALSEIHADALALLPASVVSQLTKVFEMTTVTKKLRRIARLSTYDLRTAVSQVRPHQLVFTFMNYLYPHLWHSTAPVTPEEDTFIDNMNLLGAPITLINRGPESCHILETGRS